MRKTRHFTVEITAADSYPAVMPRREAAEFLGAIKSDAVKTRLDRAVAAKRYELCDAVRASVRRLEEAARHADMRAVFDEAHDIRGLAGTAGLVASGRIADGLCFYLDAMSHANAPLDTGIVGLHVGSIVRAAYAEDEATRLGTEVDEELRALVLRRLAASAACMRAAR